MDKFLFLDFDGVLNTEFYQDLLMSQGKPYRDKHGPFFDPVAVEQLKRVKDLLMSQGKPYRDKHGPFFDPVAVEQLKRVIDSTHADIVIDSSWKFLGLEAMQDMWTDRQMPGRVIDITPSIVSASWSLNIDPDDFGLDVRQSKGIEIDFWLFENTVADARYVIIDDEYVIPDSQLPHFILTNPFDGLTELLADRAIALLNG